jgi:hypothetical protein
MCSCVCVCMCVSMCRYAHVHAQCVCDCELHVTFHACVHVLYTCTCVYMHIHQLHVHMCKFTHARICAHTCTWVHTMCLLHAFIRPPLLHAFIRPPTHVQACMYCMYVCIHTYLYSQQLISGSREGPDKECKCTRRMTCTTQQQECAEWVAWHVYKYIYIYMYIHVYVRIWKYVNKHIHTHTQTHTHTHNPRGYLAPRTLRVQMRHSLVL